MNNRPDKLVTFMKMAIVLSEQSTCVRRHVGCILLDHKYRIIGSGYNGTARGTQNCFNKPCAGANAQSGVDLHLCEAIHAEQNALMQCHNVDNICFAICTTFPCMHCLKMLANTNCVHIVWKEQYSNIDEGIVYWHSLGKTQMQIITV